MRNLIHEVKIFKVLFFLYGKEKIAKINQKIYSTRKGENSSGGFRCKKAGGINSATLSKISKTNFK